MTFKLETTIAFLALACIHSSAFGADYEVCKIVDGGRECVQFDQRCENGFTRRYPNGVLQTCRPLRKQQCEALRQLVSQTVKRVDRLPASEHATGGRELLSCIGFTATVPGRQVTACNSEHRKGAQALLRLMNVSRYACFAI